jgi:hypothetical protein
VVRDGPAAPGIHRVDAGARAGRAVSLARAHAEAGRFVGLVCPPACRAELEEALARGGVAWSGGELDSPVNLLTPQEAKGLEFDAAVVIEPEEIVAGDERGHRLLFVALTRTTRYLDIVCVGEPVPLAAPPPVVPGPRAGDDPLPDPGQLDGLAQEIATIVLSGAPAPAWDEVLQRAAGILDRQAGRTAASGRHRRD